jgi:hypothetical protein
MRLMKPASQETPKGFRGTTLKIAQPPPHHHNQNHLYKTNLSWSTQTQAGQQKIF